MAKNNNTNNNNGQNLINPIPNRNNNTSSTPDTVLEKVAENLGNLNSSMSETAKIMKDGFKQMTEHSKKQDKELNKAIGKLTSTIAENTKSNKDKTKKNNSSSKSNETREDRVQSRLDRIRESITKKQEKASEELTNVINELSKQIENLTDTTSDEAKRLKANLNDINQFFKDFDENVASERDSFTLGADKFGKAIDDIVLSSGTKIKNLTSKIEDLKNKEDKESKLKLRNLAKLIDLENARSKAALTSAKLNKTIDDLRYNSELRKAEFEARSAERSQKILDSFSDDVNSEFLKSVQSIQEYATKLEESYINTGEKGPLYNEISNTLNDMETALIKGDKESYKVNEAILKSLQQSRESIIGKGGNATSLDLMVAQQNADNAKKLALDVKAQQELADRYISNYNNIINNLTSNLTDLERQRNELELNNDFDSKEYSELLKQINTTQTELHRALSGRTSIIESANQLADGNIKTRSETIIENLKPEQEALVKQKATNYKELDELSRLRESSDLSKKDKKELDAREAFLEKQNKALDEVQDQITQMIENVQKGNLKAASKNMQNINKMKKNLDEMEKGQNEIVEAAKGSFDEMKNNLKPQGTISKLISKGLKYVANEVINYSARIQTDALTSLQNSYKNQGMNVAKTNLVTRKEVQRMMGDIGSELESQGIKGIDTTDVMDMAESLANNGIRNQKVLKEMSVAMAKAGAMNPDLKATFSDIENVKAYQRIYDEAEQAGKDGAQAVEEYLTKAASEIYGITQVTGNAFAFTNGQLAELDATIRDSSRNLGLTIEQQDEYRKSVYSLASVVGKDGSEFTAWMNNLVGLTKTGLNGDAQSIIQGTVDGQQIVDALQQGNMKEFLTRSYTNLLNFDVKDEKGNYAYNTGHRALMTNLGISDDDLQKIRTNQAYWTNGRFDADKFIEQVTKAYEAAGNNNFADKQKELLENGQMQTVEESLESKAINNLTEHFTNMVSTDIPYIVDEEIKAIDASSNLLKDVIDTGIDSIVGAISASSMGNAVGGLAGKGVGELWGSGMAGKAGVVGAGIAAFSAGWGIGTKLDKLLGFSERAGKISGETLEQYKKDEEVMKNLKSSQDKAKTATDTLAEAINANTSALNEKTKNIVNDKNFKAKMANYTGNVKEAFNSNGSVNKDYENAQGKGHAEKELKLEAQQIAGAIGSGSKEEREDYWNNYVESYLKDAGHSDKLIAKERNAYDEALKRYDEIKATYDSFHNEYSGALYQAWEWYKQHKTDKQYKHPYDAWNQALSMYISTDGNKEFWEYHQGDYAPEEGKDFIIEGNKLILKPGVYSSGAGNDEFFEYAFNRIGKYATGLEEVPYDNYLALLHKGERVQTAAQVTQDRLQEELNDSLETLNTTLINSDNGIVETFDDTQIVNTIETQTNDMSNLINSVLEILNIIANNTKYNYNTTNSSGKSNYIENAIANRSTRISDFKNPTMY